MAGAERNQRDKAPEERVRATDEGLDLVERTIASRRRMTRAAVIMMVIGVILLAVGLMRY